MSVFKIFYSWQSDLDTNSTRSFIKECIDEAIDLASEAEAIEAVRDEATLNVTGSPNIVTTLFSKIDECNLFIADVSSCYSASNNEGKSSPNPNVMLELGYAVKTIGWDRIICICNSGYGDNLPFDIAQNRITPYSFTDKYSRREEKHRIAHIIFKNIRDLKDKTAPGVGSSPFILGSYDMEEKEVRGQLVPVDFKETYYAANTEIIVERIRELVSEINNYSIQTELAKTDFQSERVPSLFQNKPIIFAESDEVRTLLKTLLDIGLTEVFFDVGSLSRGLTLPSFMGESLVGTEEEKEKYYKLSLLAEALWIYQARLRYPESFEGFCYIPIAIQNTSNILDEDIRVVVRAEKGTIIDPYDTPLAEDCIELCGYLCESYDGVSAIRDLFGLREDGIIHAEGNRCPSTVIKDPILQEWQGASAEDEAKYYAELEQYVEETDGKDYCEYEIKKLRPNECKWLGRGMMIKPDNGEIVIKYQIYSKHSTGKVGGVLHL